MISSIANRDRTGAVVLFGIDAFLCGLNQVTVNACIHTLSAVYALHNAGGEEKKMRPNIQT
jgi:hypothetical protein